MQTGKNVLVAFKEETTFNTAPGVTTGAEVFRLNPSPGLNMARANILPNEIRSDGLTPMGRLGSRSVSGSYNADLSVNSFDTLLEALMRSTWTAAVAVTSAEFTSISISSDVITWAGGSPITEGFRVGDVIRITASDEPANDNLNLRVTAVSATTITVQSPATGTTLTDDAGPDTGATITILKKLINGSTPTRRTFYLEEYNQDIDESKVFGGCRCIGFTIRGAPDGMATVEFSFLGASQTALSTANSPFYSSPTVTTTEGLVFSDALIRLGASDLAIATSFELTASLGGSTLPVIGSDYTPDVFEDQLEISGSLSMVREDLTFVTAFDNETEYELHVLLQEPSGTPRKALGIYVPRIKFTDVPAQLGQDGAMIQNLPFMVGLQAAASGYDATMLSFHTET